MSTETKTALLVMDVQEGILSRIADPEKYVTKVTALVSKAHEKQIPVIYVVVGFRAELPEINPRNKSFGTITKERAAGMVNPQPVIIPTAEDVVVTKRRVSAFTGSDLEVILRSKNIGHLVLTGISTSGVVLSTLREAADKDYQLTVLSDLCVDMDSDVHEVLINKIFPRQADVITSDEWISAQ